MRLRWGRPDLTKYADRFDVPTTEGTFSVTFLGVSSLLIDDGENKIITDAFFSRPSLREVGLSKIAPNDSRIDGVMSRAGIERLDAVIPVHTHFDHALDSAVVATRTGATLVGSASAAHIGRGAGMPPDRIRVVNSGDQVRFGSFELTFVASEHCPPDRFPGPITAPVTPPARAAAYRCGEAWSIVLRCDTGRSALIQGSAGFIANSLNDHQADVAYLGVGQLGLCDDDYVEAYWEHTVRAVGARRVVLIHWDDFFRPLDRPLRALPFAGDDLDATMRRLIPLATADDTTIHFPTLWRREDPWQGLSGTGA